jgi:ABC-type multidrug transport system fused ATPase/permease subunit
MQTVKQIFSLLSAREKSRAVLLFILSIFMAFLDMAGVASILPLMTIMNSPDVINTNYYLNWLFKISNYFGIQNFNQFLIFVFVLSFIFLVFSILFRAFTTYLQTRFVLMREFTISRALVDGFLGQPYTWFLNRHSSDLAVKILSEISSVISYGFTPLINIISQGAVSIFIVVLLMIVDFKIALIVIFTLLGFYSLILFSTRNLLKRIGIERSESNEMRFRVLSEAFGSIKEIKVNGTEKSILKKYSNSAKRYATRQTKAQLIGLMPRYFLESIAFGGMLLVMILLFSNSEDGLVSVLPVISLYAFAGYRLMPALQQIYNSLTLMRYVKSALESLNKDFEEIGFRSDLEDSSLIELKNAISLNNVRFTYPNSDHEILKGISIRIPANATVGLIGMTGSGKTTVVDLILGLLDPQSGTLEVDGCLIDGRNRRAWQRSIGYVPQQIFLTDENISANIAFGVDPDEIDQSAVETASKLASLHDFVIKELPRGYQTIVGERGVRLSGGQRQRIGIARALYRKPKILILDEATSALDTITERKVMNSLNNLSKQMTIIMIAHRIST